MDRVGGAGPHRRGGRHRPASRVTARLLGAAVILAALILPATAVSARPAGASSGEAPTDSITIAITGDLHYYDRGSTTAGVITVAPAGGRGEIVTGVATMRGARGGTAKVRIRVLRSSSRSPTFTTSFMTVVDPSVRLRLTTPVFTLTRTGPTSIVSTTTWYRIGVHPPRLAYTITWAVIENGAP